MIEEVVRLAVETVTRDDVRGWFIHGVTPCLTKEIKEIARRSSIGASRRKTPSYADRF
jgi:hypothetical protein